MIRSSAWRCFALGVVTMSNVGASAPAPAKLCAGEPRNLLVDLYALLGFRQDDPSTGYVESVQAVAPCDGRLYLDVPFGGQGCRRSGQR